MKEIANVEYFYLKCNELLGTTYAAADFGGADTIKKSINLEWLASATLKVYHDIHGPGDNCTLLLSPRFNPTESKIAITKEVVNSVVDYLQNLNKGCISDCHCPSDMNCNCVCSSTCSQNCGYMGDCTNSSDCTCNCGKTVVACACNCNCNCLSSDCGRDTECQCDCEPYACNCDKVVNLPLIAQRSMAENCTCGPYTDCPCACECNCNCPHSQTTYSRSVPSTSYSKDNHSREDGLPLLPPHNKTDQPQEHNRDPLDVHNRAGGNESSTFYNKGYAQGHDRYQQGSAEQPYEKSDNYDGGQQDNCFIANTPVTMADGTKKRIANVKIGEYVKTPTGCDKVISIEQGPSPSWRINTKNGPSLTTSSTHPFLLKNRGVGMIDPNGHQTEFNAIFQAIKLEPGTVLWSGHEVESIEKTEVVDYLYNLILENSVFYFVEDIVCLTANTYAANMIMLLANKFDPKINNEGIEKIRTFTTDEIKQKLLAQIINILRSILNNPEGLGIYHNCSKLSEYFEEMLFDLKEETIIKNLLLISNYQLSSEEK